MSSTSPSLVHRQRTKYQRSRAVKSRVRSGCVTCKCVEAGPISAFPLANELSRIRHVKCDEKKPVCDRCANAGYECDGYCYNTLTQRPPSKPFLPAGTDVRNFRVPIPRVRSITNTELVVQPSPGPRFESPIEYRYFDVFRGSAAAQLSGYYQSSVWDRVILQCCHEEPWARNVVVAIGALHQNLNTLTALSNQPQGSAESERERKSHYIFALQQYGIALGQMRDIARQEPETESQLRHALISSLLTTCFETYIGDRDKAITQAKVGIDLLLKWTKQKESADTSADLWSVVRRAAVRSLYLDEDLVGAFRRLDYQLLLCRGLQPGRPVPQFPSTQQPFTSINEACNYWDQVVGRLLFYHNVKSVEKEYQPKRYDEGPATETGSNLKEQQNFKTVAEQFLRHFEPIFQASRQKPGTNDYLLANLTMIRALACRSVVSRGSSNSEMYNDAFLRDYILIVDLARDLIDNAKNTLRKAIFNFDISLGCCISIVAHKCREPKVRRAAIALLNQYPQRGGWFDTLVAAKLATWIVTQEEEGMVNGFIPDHARLRLLKHDTGPHKQWARIYYSELVWKDGIQARETAEPVTIIL